MPTLLLNKIQIEQRINRIAYQIYEDNFEEKEIIIAGIVKGGYELAQRIKKALEKICTIKINLIEIKIDKNKQVEQELQLSISNDDLKNKVVILVDDVLNSGKTLTYSMRPFLDANVRKIRTVLLVDRDHKRYPVIADFVGFKLSTTLREHVNVEFTEGKEAVELS
ncbi:MAG: phosphoribosyltransferase family protein [Bacteroidia bacterium]